MPISFHKIPILFFLLFFFLYCIAISIVLMFLKAISVQQRVTLKVLGLLLCMPESRVNATGTLKAEEWY